MAEFSKKYDSRQEKKLYQAWSDAGVYNPDAVLSYRKAHGLPVVDKQFTIPLPPPNVTGKLHIGHAMMAAVEDILVRRHRMAGYRTLWIPGTDHAALSTNAVVEKKIRAEGKNRFEMGRDAYLTEVRKRVAEHRGHINEQMKALGSSMDREREQYTMSESLSRSVRQAFRTLYEKKKIYQDYYVVNWSPGAQSVVSDIEVVHKEEVSKLYYIRYFVDTKKHVLTIATTRPETMFADVAVAVHPDDRRYKKFIGKKVIIPVINRTIPIIGDESVDMTFGTGVLKITPGHSASDFEIAKRHNLPLNVFAFDHDNVFTSEAGELFDGKPVKDFLENVIQYINDIGNMDHVEDHTNSVPYCERTGCRIQPMASKQWFMNSTTAAEKLIHHLDEGDVQVHPQRFVKTFNSRLEKLRPWCISRQIRWGHRIPVWYGKKGTHVLNEDYVMKDEKGAMRKETGNVVFGMMVFNLIADARLPEIFSIDGLVDVLMEPSLTPQHGSVLDAYIRVYTQKAKDLNEASFTQGLKGLERLVELRDAEDKDAELAEAIVDLMSDCFIIEANKQNYRFVPDVLVDDTELRQETDTLDTWFSSALRPFSILGWPEKTEDLDLYYPNSVLETGYDIILFRVIKMMIMGVEVMGKLPFDHVYLHGLVRDENGIKMSKSLGNVINPLEIIEEYGSDALRLSLISSSKPGNDINFSLDKTKYYRRFLNKLWNASRFVVMNIDKKLPRDMVVLEEKLIAGVDQLQDFDLWLLHILKDLIYDTDKSFDRFNLGEVSHQICQSIRQYYCDRYIEISKVHSSDMTQVVLLYSLGRLLQLLHPFAPFVTATLWSTIGFTTELAMWDIPRLDFALPTKNYRHNLMMDSITQLRNLKNHVTEKGHHKVDAIIQGSSDIVGYLQEHEALVKSLVGINEIAYLREGEKIPEGYQTGLVINITLGVKGGEQKIDKAQLLKNLEKELIDEQGFLQGLRNTLMKPGFKDSAPANVVEAKEQKLEEVKKKIDGIEHELKRLKSRL